MARWRGISLTLLVALGLTVAGCGSSRGTSSVVPAASAGTAVGKIQAIPVQTVVVASGRLEDSHAAAGSVVPVKQSNVAAQASGVVVSLFHQAGDWVDRGETVVGLNDSQMKLALQSAEASLRSAQVSVGKTKAQADLANLTVQRNASLIKQNLIPQSQADADSTAAAAAYQDYLSAQAAVDQANAQLAQARLNLEYASIKAPFPGQLSAVSVTEGEYVGQNTPAFTLVSSDRQINFAVPPSDASVLPAGTPVQFNFGGQSYSARVSQAPSASINGVVPVVALFSGSFAPPYGTIGTVAYSVTLARGVVVPIGALQTNENQNFVFAVVDGKAAARPIKILGETGVAAAVSGIEAGASVILYPPPGLLDGSAVKPLATEGSGAGGQAGASKGTAGGRP